MSLFHFSSVHTLRREDVFFPPTEKKKGESAKARERSTLRTSRPQVSRAARCRAASPPAAEDPAGMSDSWPSARGELLRSGLAVNFRYLVL